MRRLLLILLLLLALPIGLLGAVWLALEDQPLVGPPAALGAPEIERVKRLLAENDPRPLKASARRAVSLTQRDLDLLVDYLASRHAGAGARIVLAPGSATIAATAELARSPVGRFLNLRASVREAGGTLRLEQVRVGRLPVPDLFVNLFVDEAHARLVANDDFRAARDALKRITLAEGRIEVTFEWRPELPARLTRALIPATEQQRLLPYQERLAELTRGASRAAEVPLVTVLQPLFELAGDRGRAGDPVAENRAALLVLAVYASGRGLGTFVPAASEWPRAAARTLTLNGREDLAQHFAISAALAASTGVRVADAIGLQKEIDDSRGGSGFSFGDLAANRAGTRFGETATASPSSARTVQARTRAGLRDADIMVSAADLPDFMPEAEFERRFGGVDAPAYRRMTAEIERRIDALPLHRK
jgi:uncharacterized protein YfiM (DUF2279 family)